MPDTHTTPATPAPSELSALAALSESLSVAEFVLFTRDGRPPAQTAAIRIRDTIRAGLADTATPLADTRARIRTEWSALIPDQRTHPVTRSIFRAALVPLVGR